MSSTLKAESLYSDEYSFTLLKVVSVSPTSNRKHLSKHVFVLGSICLGGACLGWRHLSPTADRHPHIHMVYSARQCVYSGTSQLLRVCQDALLSSDLVTDGLFSFRPIRQLIGDDEVETRFLRHDLRYLVPCYHVQVVCSGSLPAVKLIVEKAGGDCIEQRDAKNHTPLILATIGGHGEVVNYLLSVGGKHLACCSLTRMSHSQLSEPTVIGQTDRLADRQTDRQTDRLADRQTDRQTRRQTDRQTDSQTDLSLIHI